MNKKTTFGHNRFYSYSGPRIKCRQDLLKFWRDLHDDQDWKYDELGPIELLEKANILCQTIPEEELDRVNWFWRRRPHILSLVAGIFWLIAAMGASFWVMIPCLGVPTVITSIALVLLAIVRSVRWRREYEFSVDRLIRTRHE
jgi:hypothetical protein